MRNGNKSKKKGKDMKKTCYGMILKVRNLPLCRAYYKNILALGDPVIDSSFLCEFHIEKDFSLILEKAEWEFMPQKAESRSSWILRTEDLATFLHRLDQYGYKVETKDADKFGIRLLKCKDPEGNVFFVTENKIKGE